MGSEGQSCVWGAGVSGPASQVPFGETALAHTGEAQKIKDELKTMEDTP